MAASQNHRVIASYRVFANYCSIFAIGMGLLVLYGWAFNIPSLKSMFPDLATMKANTAICFVLSGIALWFGNYETATITRLWIARSCAAFVVLLGTLTLVEFAFGADLGIDQLLFRDTETLEVAYPGRIGFTSAINFVLLGISLYMLTVRDSSTESISQSLALVAGIIALLVFLGYLYDVEALHTTGRYSQMALHATIAFMSLAVGICCARPQRGLIRLVTADSVDGEMARRLLPVLIGIPIILGWLILWGERSGFYDLAFALALMVILATVMLSFVVWWNAGWLRQVDRKRK